MNFDVKALLDLRANRRLRNWIVVMFDTVAAGGAFVLAYLTVFNPRWVMLSPELPPKVVMFVIISGVCFVLLRQYRASWRYVSIPDLLTMIRACLVAVVVYTVAAFLATRGQDVPRSVLVLSFVYMVGILSAARLAYRILFEKFSRMPRSRNGRKQASRSVLLCGFSDRAESFVRSSRRDRYHNFDIVGILDDSPLNHDRFVQGVKVVGSLDQLAEIVAAAERDGTQISELIVTEVAPGRRRLADILAKANACGLKVSRIPDLSEMLTITSDTLVVPRPIELADLLERPEVTAKLENVARLLAGKIVLVTGAGGSIGSELSRQIATFAPRQLIITDNSEFQLYTLHTGLRDDRPDLAVTMRIMDVRDRARVNEVLAEYRPEVVFHAAALKHVPIVEENPVEAIKTNLLGTRNVADAALANEAATFVMISTDKAVNPTNIMGATKRAAEAYCQALDLNSKHTRFKTVRFGNVLGSNGSVVPRFQEQIAAGGPVTVTHPNIVRYFMTIPEAVRLVLHASAHAIRSQGERGKIMVLDMGKPVRILDLAERMIQLAGYKPGSDIEIVFSGLRPGEKLYEELFDPSEVQAARTEDGFIVASPRVLDYALLGRTLSQIESLVGSHDASRVIELLLHLVPEYHRPTESETPPTRAEGAVAAWKPSAP